MWVRSHTNHDDADGAKIYVSYFTPWGKYVKDAIGTIDSTDGTTEVIIYKTSGTTYIDGTLATETNACGDIWYIADVYTDTTPTSNSHEFLLTDEACSNVDGSGGDVYGVIKEGEYNSTFTRLRVPVGYDGWVARIEVTGPPAAAATDTFEIDNIFYADGESIRKQLTFNFNGCMVHDPCVLLEEAQDAYFQILDTAGAGEVSFCGTYLLAKRNTIS